MCGRFFLTSAASELAEFFDIRGVPELAPQYNIAPTDPVLGVVGGGPEWYRWGLIPHWAKDLQIGARMINARAETVAEKPAFRDSWRRGQRLLIPASGFFEWTGKTGAKQPHAIVPREAALLAFAGLWDRNRRGTEEVLSCTILTRDPVAEIAPLHDRMPVLVPRSCFDSWLRGSQDDAMAILAASPDLALRHYPVSRAMSDPRFKEAQAIAAIEA